MTYGSFTIDGTKARFESFNDAADCAVQHARQRGGEAIIRTRKTGWLLADLRLIDGAVSVRGVGTLGRAMVEEWVQERS